MPNKTIEEIIDKLVTEIYRDYSADVVGRIKKELKRPIVKDALQEVYEAGYKDGRESKANEMRPSLLNLITTLEEQYPNHKAGFKILEKLLLPTKLKTNN